jgi:hypothetical protein
MVRLSKSRDHEHQLVRIVVEGFEPYGEFAPTIGGVFADPKEGARLC